MRPYLAPAGLSVLVGLIGPAAALALAPAPATGPVLIVSSDPAAVVARAGGRLIGPAVAPFAALSDGPGDYADRARESGAWVVTSAEWLAALCREV